MLPTPFGAIVVAIGLYILLRGTLTQMLGFVMCATLFGGSAAIAMPALGGSTIPPAELSLVFLALRATLPGPGQMARLPEALKLNAFLIVFCLYGVVSAFTMPFLLKNQIDVTPLKPGGTKRDLYITEPLHFTSQNITTPVYMLGAMVGAIGASIAAARPRAERTVVNVAIVLAIAHATLGFISVIADGTPLDYFIRFFRNGHYAQLDQSIGGISRMNGIWPEASGFAGYAGAMMLFQAELWLRDVRPRWTGFAAAYLAIALAISTSSTAYIVLGGYSVVLLIRALLFPGSIPFRKLFALGTALFAVLTLAMLVAILVPPVLETALRVVTIMTVEKSDSVSGRQRLFWALQGLDAFRVSWGLGIGAGSFRSSSSILAILGCLGVIGIVGFFGQLISAFKPLRRSTWYEAANDREAVGTAAAWTALCMLGPTAVGAPSCDPGIVWSLFTGLALALRSRQPAPRTALRPRTPPPRAASA